MVDHTTKSSTFDREMTMIKEELDRWFSILESEYNGWKTGAYRRDIIYI